MTRLREFAGGRGLHFDAMNSMFQDQPEQKHSYKFGSLTHPDPAVRAQAVAHNIDCIEIERLGSKAHTVWIGDGGIFRASNIFAARWSAISKVCERFMRRCLTTGESLSSTVLRAGVLFDGD